MERRKLVALVVATAVVSVSILSVLLYTGFFDSTYNHGPISITSDQEFTEENGVTGGSGTEEDPFIIEGWRIGPSDVELGPEAAVVLIKDVSRHFVIRNTDITGPNAFGIMLKNCKNGAVYNSTLTLCYQGISLYDCSDCAVRDNNLSSCPIGLTVGGTDGTDIKNNQFNREIEGYPAPSGLGLGLRMYSPAEDVTVTGNRFCEVGLDLDFFTLPDDGSSSGLTIADDNTVNGKPVRFLENQKDVNLSDLPVGQIIMFNCTNSLISQLEITQVTTAILLNKVDDCIISDCSLSNTTWMGSIFARNSNNVTIRSISASDGQVYLTNCSRAVLEDNELSSVNHGLYMDDCDNVTIHGNLIHECNMGMSLRGENVTVTNNILLSNGIGIMSDNIFNLQVFYNDFIDNNRSAETSGGLKPMFFHNATSCMGNYWSDYDGRDEDADGIGDTPYLIESTGQDDYPLMAPVNS